MYIAIVVTARLDSGSIVTFHSTTGNMQHADMIAEIEKTHSSRVVSIVVEDCASPVEVSSDTSASNSENEDRKEFAIIPQWQPSSWTKSFSRNSRVMALPVVTAENSTSTSTSTTADKLPPKSDSLSEFYELRGKKVLFDDRFERYSEAVTGKLAAFVAARDGPTKAGKQDRRLINKVIWSNNF